MTRAACFLSFLISSSLTPAMFHFFVYSNYCRRQGIENARRLFNKIDSNGNGAIELSEFIAAYQEIDPTVTQIHLRHMFEEADVDENGRLTFDEFLKVQNMPNLLAELVVKNRDSRGLVQVMASTGEFNGFVISINSRFILNTFFVC